MFNSAYRHSSYEEVLQGYTSAKESLLALFVLAVKTIPLFLLGQGLLERK